MSTHIPADLALFLAALDPEDAERKDAWAHAAHCADCRQLLERGEAMLALIDAQSREQPVDAQLRQRILRSVERLGPTPRRARWEPRAIMLGAAAALLFALLDGRMRVGLGASHGMRCLFFDMLFASLPLVATGLWAQSGARHTDALRFAGIGALGAVAGQIWLRVRCPMHDMNPHSLVFHAGGVLLGALLGVVAARALRSAPRRDG